MFLRQRSTQAEFFDSPDRTPEEVAEGYRWLARFNRLLVFAEPFQRYLPRLLGPERCRKLCFLDLGAGDGSLGRTLSAWAQTRGWHWHFTNLEINPYALRPDAAMHNVTASAMALPFQNASFDVVIASQMTHHLPTEADVVQHFREAWRVSREAMLINDLHRNPVLLAMIWGLLHWFGCPPDFRADGLLSVRRGWRVSEWRRLLKQAQIPEARVFGYYGAKVICAARKTSAL